MSGGLGGSVMGDPTAELSAAVRIGSSGDQKGRMSATPETEPVEQWIAEISARSSIPITETEGILARYNIAPARALPPTRRLFLNTVHFAGIKDIAIDGRPDKRELVPFSFTHKFAAGLTAFGTRNKNDAGKSSLLEVIMWGLRGSCDLQKDVRRWIRQAAIEITLAGDRVLIGWTVDNGRPRGRALLLNAAQRMMWKELDSDTLSRFQELLTEAQDSAIQSRPHQEILEHTSLDRFLASLTSIGVVELTEFDGDREFEAAVGELMLARLGFQRLPQWQKAPKKARVDETDGSLGEHGWSAWSQALVITNPAIKVPLGEQTYVSARLLQVYLGTAWAAPAAVAAARKSQLENRLGVLRRRAESVEAERTNSLRELQAEIRDLSTKLATMPETDAVAESERLLTEIAAAGEAYAAAQATYTAAAATYGTTAKLLESIEADEYALGQAAVTRRFWHSLKPTCCPRCDTTVEEGRWQRELEGHCSLCGSDVDLATEEPDPRGQREPLSEEEAADLVRRNSTDIDLDQLDDLSAVRLQIAQLRARLSEEDAALDAAQAARDGSRARLEAARQAGMAVNADAVRARHDVELALARVHGQIAERARSSSEGPDALTLRETRDALSVVTAAEFVARRRRDANQQQLLTEVSALVTDLGRRLGVTQLESATLKGNLNMPVVKGGQPDNFGNLTEGEVLRLKIALVIALLRVGTSAGVGRHPGLLLIDSLGREEVNPGDLVTMVEELQRIALDAQLQIVATSAYGDILEQALPDDSLRVADVGETMW